MSYYLILFVIPVIPSHWGGTKEHTNKYALIVVIPEQTPLPLISPSRESRVITGGESTICVISSLA